MLSFSDRRARHLRLGRRGERIAARLFRELGVDVLVRNYRRTAGEIDLVARDGGMLCFVEVKTRRREVHGRPAEAVGTAKRRRIIRAAKSYLRELNNPALPYRYDIVEVIARGPFVHAVRYWRNAFTDAAGFSEHAPGRVRFETKFPDST